jgi:hypothetical protein
MPRDGAENPQSQAPAAIRLSKGAFDRLIDQGISFLFALQTRKT